MKKVITSISVIFVIINLMAFSCKKEDNSPVGPVTHGTIEGTTTSFKTGLPLEMVNIYSVPASSFVKTDNSGKYRINTVEPGEYQVYAAKNGFDTLMVSVTVVASATAAADFILVESDTNKTKQLGQISGTILNSKTFVPVENVNLTSVPATSSITSDASGKYIFVNVAPGKYTLFPDKVGFDTTSVSVNVIAGQVTNADIFLTESDTTILPTTGTIIGSVFDAQSSQPIAQALVSTTPSTGTVFTAPDGSFSFANITPGDYTVSVSKVGYQNASTKITVFAGEETKANFSLLTSTGTIIGTVTDDSTHLPISGVNIQTQPGTASTTTDSNGKFAFSKIAPNTYTVNASASGYIDANITVVIAAGDTTQADISMVAN